MLTIGPIYSKIALHTQVQHNNLIVNKPPLAREGVSDELIKKTVRHLEVSSNCCSSMWETRRDTCDSFQNGHHLACCFSSFSILFQFYLFTWLWKVKRFVYCFTIPFNHGVLIEQKNGPVIVGCMCVCGMCRHVGTGSNLLKFSTFAKTKLLLH